MRTKLTICNCHVCDQSVDFNGIMVYIYLYKFNESKSPNKFRVRGQVFSRFNFLDFNKLLFEHGCHLEIKDYILNII